MNKTLLEVKNISLSYEAKTYILKDISFSLSPGEILSIIGLNGTGKSSLLKAIAGIQKVSSGEIISHANTIAYVPQKISLDQSFPILVEEFFCIFNENISDIKINETLELFQIQKLRKRNIHSLSGWEFQKVMILNALLSQPDLLLLDEPTTGIDVMSEELFYKNIAEIKKLFPKLSIILVSHNINMVYKNSSRVICLHENNFCCHGTPSEIQENVDVQKIFWEYVRPYKHNPHKDHHHTH